MKNKKLLLKILSRTIFFILLNPVLAAYAYGDPTQDFISTQTTIRIVADDAPGFGDQAASLNIVHWLRENKKYAGDIEFIYGYGDETKGKIISLFNLPKDIPDDWTDALNKIRFIRKNVFITLNKNKAITRIPLGINGGSSDILCGSSPFTDAGINRNDKYANLYIGLTALECHNFANFYNTNIFIEVSPYPEPANHSIGTVSLRDQTETGGASIPVKINNTYVPVSVSDIAKAKKLVENNADLSHRLPALIYFINSIINQDVNVLPIYADTIRTAPYIPLDPDSFYVGNMLQIIAAAYYAQQKGLGADKPLIIAVFYNYDQEAQELNAIIHDDKWGELINQPGAAEARAAIKQLNLQSTFSIASLSQPETVALFQKINGPENRKKIVLLSIGAPLPKDIFDAIYTHTGNNVWPQIREGANSFNSLVITGEPHFRCAGPAGGGTPGWEIGYDLMTDLTLQNRFNNLYFGRDIKNNNDDSYRPIYENEFCGGMITWEAHSHIYQELGDLFIDAANPDSALSRYFQLLKTEATKPENDRIARLLEFGLQLSHP